MYDFQQEILRNKTEEAQTPGSNDEEQNVHGKGVKLVLKMNTEESLTPTCRDFTSEDDSNSMHQSKHPSILHYYRQTCRYMILFFDIIISEYKHQA